MSTMYLKGASVYGSLGGRLHEVQLCVNPFSNILFLKLLLCDNTLKLLGLL